MSEHKTTSRVTMSPEKPVAVEDQKPAAIESAEVVNSGDNDMKPTAQVKPFSIVVSTTIDTTNGIRFIKRTLGELERNGQGPKNGRDKEILKTIQMKLLGCINHIDKIMIKKGLKVVQNSKDSTLILKVLLGCVNSTGIYYIKRSRGWKVGASFSLNDGGGYFGRTLTQLEEDEIEINEDNAYVCMSLEEMQGLVDVDPQLKELLSDLMQICSAFIGYYNDDAGKHKQKLFDHLLIAVFETYFAFAIDGNDPGYIAERLLNFGSDLIWEYIRAPEYKLNAKPISWLRELRQDIKVYILETWETYISAIRALIRENDMCNNDEVMAMLRPELYHWYLNRYTTKLVWGNGGPNQSETSLLGEEPFPDALSCPILADVKDVAEAIKAVLEGLRDETITQGNATSQFKELLERITIHKKAYAPPSDNDLQAGGEERLMEIIASVKSQPQAAALISTERALIDLMDDNDGYWGKLIKDADSCEVFAAGMEVGEDGEDQRPIKAGTLFKIILDEMNCKTLLIYVTYSPHVVLGHGTSFPSRLSQGSRMITNTSIFEAAGLVQEGSTDIIIERFRFFFINAEGPFGDLSGKKEEEDRQQSKFYFAARLALPPGYYVPPIRRGVQALAHAISPGMLKHHAIALMAFLGYNNFCTFLRIHCNLELGPAKDFEMELEKLRREHKSLYRQQLRLKRKEILRILMTQEEQRSIDDLSVLDDWVMINGTYGTTRKNVKTTEATLVVDLLDESSTNDDFSAAAKEVHSILCKGGTSVRNNRMKKQQFCLFLLAAGYSEGIIGRLKTADEDIYFGSPNQSINQSTNVDLDIDELITLIE